VATLAQIVVIATEAGAEEGLQLLPAPAELIWGLVSFALLMAFMSRFVFPRLNAMLDERAARIQGQIEEAEAQRQEAERLRRQYEEQLADARNQAQQIVEEARRDAERVRGELTRRAEEEARQIVERAREDAEASRARVVADLRNQVALASVELAGRIVQRELDPERHRALVDQYINELSGLN
jgi:F-type H+-transporting ATPase subunit b